MKISRKIISSGSLGRPKRRRVLSFGDSPPSGSRLTFSQLGEEQRSPDDLGTGSDSGAFSFGSLSRTVAQDSQQYDAHDKPMRMSDLDPYPDTDLDPYPDTDLDPDSDPDSTWLRRRIPEKRASRSGDDSMDLDDFDSDADNLRASMNPIHGGMTQAQSAAIKARKDAEYAAALAKYGGGDSEMGEDCLTPQGSPKFSDSLITPGKACPRMFSVVLERAIDSLRYSAEQTLDVTRRISMLDKSLPLFRDWNACPVGTMNVVSPKGEFVNKRFLPELLIYHTAEALTEMRVIEQRLHTEAIKRTIPIVAAVFNQDLSIKLERLDHTQTISHEEMQHHCFDFLMKEVQSYRTHGFFVADDEAPLLFKLDISPGNIMKDSEGHVKLVDWATSSDNTNMTEEFLIIFFSQVQSHVREDQKAVVISELLNVLKESLALGVTNAVLTEICRVVCKKVISEYSDNQFLVKLAQNLQPSVLGV
jgi:hypothetical protein